MFTNYEAVNLIEEFNRQVNQKAKKLRMIMSLIVIILTLFLVWLVLSINAYSEVKIFISVLGGIIMVGLFMVLIFSSVIMGSSVTYNYLFPKVYEKINTDLNLNLTVRSKNKVDNKFLEEGKIFLKQARVGSYRDVSGKTENGKSFRLLDCTLITGGGQYQQVHLNGIYLFFEVNSDISLQIRTHGKPQGRNNSYEKVEEIEDLKVFINKDNSLGSTEKMLLQKFKEIKRKMNAKYTYLSLDDNKFHLAYVPKPKYRAQNKLTPDKLNHLYQAFKDELELIDELVNTLSF